MTVVLQKLPETLKEFIALAEGKLCDPEYTCTLFLCALNLFVKDRDAGINAVNVLKGPQPLSNYEIHWLKDRLYDKTYLPMVYFEGSTPENSYTPSLPYTVSFLPDQRPQNCQTGYRRLYIQTPGFDTPRYFVLRQKGDNWYIWEVYSIMLGVRTPAAEDPWA